MSNHKLASVGTIYGPDAVQPATVAYRPRVLSGYENAVLTNLEGKFGKVEIHSGA